MAPEALTFVDGGDATIPPTTSVVVESTNQGKVPVVFLGYEDGSNDVQLLGDVDGIPVQGTTTITDLTVASTNTPINVGDATSSTQLIAANSSRKGWRIQNMSTAGLSIREGGTVSSSARQIYLRQYESAGQKIMDGDLWTGAINGIWDSDAGGTAIGGDW
jgi:hypothetical protein